VLVKPAFDPKFDTAKPLASGRADSEQVSPFNPRSLNIKIQSAAVVDRNARAFTEFATRNPDVAAYEETWWNHDSEGNRTTVNWAVLTNEA
jgi:hypothetical protein